MQCPGSACLLYQSVSYYLYGYIIDLSPFKNDLRGEYNRLQRRNIFKKLIKIIWPVLRILFSKAIANYFKTIFLFVNSINNDNRSLTVRYYLVSRG